MQTNHLFGCALLLAGCSTSPTDNPLPSATNTPHLQSLVTNVACGQDIAFYGSPTPDLRYTFTYDSGARLTHAEGVWVESGTIDTSDLTWAGDNLTHMISTSGWDGSESEVDAHYDAANNLVDYTYAFTSPDYQDAWTYSFSSFIGAGQPTRQVITHAGQPAVSYDLVYDANDRLVAAIPDSGPSTTWTYDDVARTIIEDTGNGAFVGLLAYDAQNRELSAAYTGSDPSVIDYDVTYAWAGDDLDTIMYRSGSEQAPHQLEVFEVDTMRYACASARKLAGRPSRFTRIGR